MGKKFRQPTFTQDRLKALLRYDPDSGVFTWIDPQSNRVKTGSRAGYVGPSGHRVIRIDRQLLPASSLAVFYMTGVYPSDLVDHKNRVPTDDSYSNLRLADYPENGFNTTGHSDSALGLKGVHQHVQGRFCAQISARGKREHLGLFDTPAEAHAAYLARAEELHGEFFVGRRS